MLYTRGPVGAGRRPECARCECLRAKAILSGGESGDPDSPHFTDQAVMFSRGQFRDVLFEPADVSAHAVRTYHPGDSE
jgi:acyl-homoserine-lactone acylase